MADRAKTVAKLIAGGRVLFGLGCLVAPRKVIGPAGARAEGQLRWMVRAFGVRDLVLGAGALVALDADGDAGIRWVEAGAVADSLDTVNALLFARELEPSGTAATLALAVPASLGGWWSSRRLRATT